MAKDMGSNNESRGWCQNSSAQVMGGDMGIRWAPTKAPRPTKKTTSTSSNPLVALQPPPLPSPKRA